MEPNHSHTGVVFSVADNVPVLGGSAAQRSEHGKRVGAGTMSLSGVTCPCCTSPTMTMEDIRLEGKAGRLGLLMTCVVVDGKDGKEFRQPTEEERMIASECGSLLDTCFEDVPFGVPNEPIADKEALGIRIPLYGITRWSMLYTQRQLLALGTIIKHTRSVRERMSIAGCPPDWSDAIEMYLACGVDRLVDYCNMNTKWKVDVPTINNSISRFVIQITWDCAEGNPIGNLAGSYWLCLNRIAVGLDTLVAFPSGLPAPRVINQSATTELPCVDLVITDPPYYAAIPYSDLMDWFYVWLRRCVWDLSDESKLAMSSPLGPKWNVDQCDGELIDDSSRHSGGAVHSKRAYEDGMARSFSRCADALSPQGKMVVVFANKQPDAWETLVSSVIRAGFVVEGSWPIQTEQPGRSRGQSSAALASSVWLVCKKRPETARPGWDNRVLEEMRYNIHTRLRDYWDVGIRGPDFVWAAK